MEILLITTKGCEGCKIQENLIQDAIKNSGLDITFNKADVNDCRKSWLKIHNVKDFPTTMMFDDANELKFQFSGTRPVIVIERYIDVHLLGK